MTTEQHPGFRAWLSWRDGKAALRRSSLLAMLLYLMLNELLPLRTLLPGAGLVERMALRVVEFLLITTIIMYITWLLRRDRIVRDPAREEASS